MPIQWRSFRPRLVGPQFLRVPPHRYIWFCSKPSEHAIIDLHWLESGKGSFPCMGKDCMLCPARIETHVYSIVLWTPSYLHPSWAPAILDLGKPDKELVQLDLRGRVVQVGRKGGTDKETALEIVKQLKVPNDAMPKLIEHRDVKPYLMARWNVAETEAYYAPRDDAPQGKLDFNIGASGE